MRRREFITLLGGAAAPIAQPFVARADKTRRIGVLMNLRSDDPEGQNRLAAFVQALQQFGWTENIIFVLTYASTRTTPIFAAAMPKNWSRWGRMLSLPPLPRA